MGLFSKLFGKGGGADKTYREKDNRGMRIETQSQSVAYWMGERLQKEVKDPFVYYIFTNEASPRAALLEMPFLHEASDSGKLVCDNVFHFGYYATENGEWDAFVAGRELTHDLWEGLHSAFQKHGGRKKSDLEPAKGTKTVAGGQGNAKKVQFVREDRTNGATYRTYKGGNKADALAFLSEQSITQREYYVVVETPEGNFGKDIQGFYQE